MRHNVRMGQITESCLGKMLDAEKNKGEFEPYLANINVRWGSFDLTNLSLMRFEDDENERYGIRYNDLIVCEGGEPGRCALWTEDIPNMKIQKALHRVRALDGTDIRYIYYWMFLAGKLGLLQKYFTGSTIKHLPGDKFREIELQIPNYPEQVAIADFLCLLDQKIKVNLEIIETMEQMTKTIYDYWFLQFNFPDENGNPYRQSGGKMVYSKEMNREIPKGWTVKALSDVILSVNTGLNPRNNFVLGDGDVRYVTVKNLTTSGVLDFTGCDTISRQTKSIIHKRSNISIGDILFASIAPLGRCYLIQSEPENWEINESVFSIRVNLKAITPEYLYMHFMSDAFVKRATSHSTGSVFQGIRISTLLDMRTVTPPKEITDSFTNEIKNLLKMKEERSKENQELESLRNFLLPMLMNGQAKVV